MNVSGEVLHKIKRFILLFCTIFSISILHSGKLFSAKTVRTPEQYAASAESIGNWLMKGMSHKPVISAMPMGRMPHGYIEKDDNYEYQLDEDLGFEVGYSIMNYPIRDEIKQDFETFYKPVEEMPDKFRISRFHLIKAFTHKLDMGMSILSAYGTGLWGAGADLKYLLGGSSIFYTSALIDYSYITKSNYLKSTVYGFTLLQSIEIFYIDIYYGFKIMKGSVKFTPDTGEKGFKESYMSDVKEHAQFITGVRIPFYENYRLTFEFQKFGDESLYLWKFSFKAPSIVTFMPWLKNRY